MMNRRLDTMLIYGSELISSFGSGMAYIGINWYLYEKTQSSSIVGYYMITFIISALLALPFAGPISDRFSKKRIILLCHLIRGIVFLGVLGIIGTSQKGTYTVFALAIVSGAAWAFYMPASRALIQEILPEDKYTRSNSFLEIALQCGNFGSAAVCGYLLSRYGIELILILNALAFFIGFLVIIPIKNTNSIHNASTDSTWSQFKHGIEFQVSRPQFFTLGIALFVPFSVTIASNAVLPEYISNYLKLGAIDFGITEMLYGVGALASGFIVSLAASQTNQEKSLGVGLFLLSAVVLAVLASTRSVHLLFVCYFIFGLSNSAIRIILSSISMKAIPKHIYGRIMASWMITSMLIQITLIYAIGKVVHNTNSAVGYLILSITTVIALGFYTVYLWAKRAPKEKTLITNTLIQEE